MDHSEKAPVSDAAESECDPLCGYPKFRKILLVSVKFLSAILGPGMQENLHVHKIPRFRGGGILGFFGGGADFILMGTGIFLINNLAGLNCWAVDIAAATAENRAILVHSGPNFSHLGSDGFSRILAGFSPIKVSLLLLETHDLSGTGSRIARFPESRAWNRQKFRSEKQKYESNRSKVASQKTDSESPSESQPINA